MTRPQGSYWSGKRAVVTGGSRGLGLAFARCLAKSGAAVAIAASSDDSLQQALAELQPLTGAARPCLAFRTNVLQDADVEQLASGVVDALGGIDLWINCAGKSSRGSIAETSLDEFRELWELNFLATVRCSLAALPHLQQSRGHLINIGSLATKFAPRWLGAYPTSKHPLAAFCQQLRLEQRESGLHVLLVCPGPLTRDDAGERYGVAAKGLPAEAAQPGGGAKVNTLAPKRVAERSLLACEKRKPELILPGKARLLAILSQCSAAWGDWLLLRKSS